MAIQATPNLSKEAQSSASVTNSDTSRRSVLLQNLAALAFGVVVLFAVGFLPMSSVHNAAHDTRHSVTFPCH